ncbi:hypothetical protein Kirov_8 [Bacillus phage Kirov]|uniref:Uncharacterized protein n=1 Tax=Bacillus phage Kirov TaxID=2783539 RepID=A0A7S6TYP1_9CAUD|nr:hypothetical protein PQE67_gp008 [Bacillus phage Kirov]QOV08207.1 hypothetical protein Kirov_8 [Bacillus phage Kirov]
MIARQPVVITVEDLRELLGLPEDVYIVDVGYDKKYGLGEISFQLVSAEPIEGLTRIYAPDAEAIRRMGMVSIEKWKEVQNG